MSEAKEPLPTLQALYEEMRQKFPPEYVEQFEVQGEVLDFVPWYRYVERLHEIAPMEWSVTIPTVTDAGGYLILTVRLTIAGQQYEQIGIARADKSKAKGYGGAAPEAFSQGFRRACAMAGMGTGFYLGEYDEPAEPEPEVIPPTETQVERMQQYFSMLEANGREDLIERAREQIAEAYDRKAKTGVVLRKLKEFLEEKGWLVDMENDPFTQAGEAT